MNDFLFERIYGMNNKQTKTIVTQIQNIILKTETLTDQIEIESSNILAVSFPSINGKSITTRVQSESQLSFLE